MSPYHPYSIFPLGDSALIIDFGSGINPDVNDRVMALFQQLRAAHYDFIRDLIPCYNSLAVYYDTILLNHSRENHQSCFDMMAEMIENFEQDVISPPPEKALRRVPVCYGRKFGYDMEFLSAQNKLNEDEIIQLHTSRTYRVYMIGFLPGFAYMGDVDERIAIPRKPDPKPVAAGAVGIAGSQTGIYPLDSPGGWHIIGRTPMKIFDAHKQDPVLFVSGDLVQFYSITEDEFENYTTGRA